VVFFEEGGPLLDGEPGDLKFVLRTLPHARFERAGADLRHNLTISLVDALVGFATEARGAPASGALRSRKAPSAWPLNRPHGTCLRCALIRARTRASGTLFFKQCISAMSGAMQ